MMRRFLHRQRPVRQIDDRVKWQCVFDMLCCGVVCGWAQNMHNPIRKLALFGSQSVMDAHRICWPHRKCIGSISMAAAVVFRLVVMAFGI